MLEERRIQQGLTSSSINSVSTLSSLYYRDCHHQLYLGNGQNIFFKKAEGNNHCAYPFIYIFKTTPPYFTSASMKKSFEMLSAVKEIVDHYFNKTRIDGFVIANFWTLLLIR